MRASALVAALLAVALSGALPAGTARAQDDLAMGRVQSSVLIIDVDRLLAETAYGRRLSEDILRRGEALDAENDRIAAALTAEERSLTERRPTMDPQAFRAEADAFDARVQRIRTEQDAKQQALESAVAEGRDAFLAAATEALSGLMRDREASVIMERRDVFLNISAVDVTDDAIGAIDAAIGSGEAADAPSDEVQPDGAPADVAEPG